jgi:serine phosphatase RsbU (regulator of sigma subunit)
MALARFGPGARHLRFAGARLALWLFLPGGEFRELRGNRQSLGYRRSDPDFPFTACEVPLPPGTSCYLFTDGILDQHGGTRGFSFGARRLRETLRSLQALPMVAQGAALERTLGEYRGTNPQRDDTTFLGLRTAPESGQE